MAKRGRDTMRFGPLKPVGLRDPRTGREAYAVVQLRQEDRAGRMWNLVGFQTRLRIPEQQRVLRMIPGLADAEFLRYGSIHRNSYLNSPAALSAHLAVRDEPAVLFAGQITGRRRLHRELRHGIARGNQPRANSLGRRSGDSSADDDDRRALPLHERGGPEALPADEREFRPSSTSFRSKSATKSGSARCSPSGRCATCRRGSKPTASTARSRSGHE